MATIAEIQRQFIQGQTLQQTGQAMQGDAFLQLLAWKAPSPRHPPIRVRAFLVE